MNSELQKNFNTQENIALAIVNADAISALKEIGVIDSICKKINPNTIQWSALEGLYFVKALVEKSGWHSEADRNELVQHSKNILQTIFKVLNKSDSYYQSTIPSIIYVICELLPIVNLDLFEFLANRLLNMIQFASEDILCYVTKSACQCLQKDTPDKLVIKRIINELVRSVLIEVENMTTLHMNFIQSLENLLNLCNEKQYVGLWEVIFASYITLIKPNKIANGYLVGDWASDVMENLPNYFQGEMAKYLTSFKISIHNILMDYVDWDMPYVITDETIIEEPLDNTNIEVHTKKVEKTEQLHYYMYFSRYLILGTPSERKVVASRIECVLEKHSEAPWIVDFALTNVHECHLILDSKDYKDPTVVNILKNLFKVL